MSNLLADFLKNWKTVAIIALAVFSIYSYQSTSAYKAAIEAQAENHKEDIRILSMFHQKQIDEQKRIVEEYEEKLKLLEEENAAAMKELEKKKKKAVTENIKDFTENQQEVIDKIKDLWGFTHVK
tara:strand:+ start:117 stop:491 length:375 start_codon:yes stop_codon:yes gene_type:complete